MSDLAISVQGIGKHYRIAHQAAAHEPRGGRWSSLASPLRRFARSAGRATEEETFWAVRDISFDVRPGEVIGFVGLNGAGKSTLLKILSRITEPSEGRALIYGRVGTLLEVGTGFHPELTGRENVYLSGAILGMRRHEIDRKFDEIVAFAEIERFLDLPVKRYSSGMYVRLAFAVAAHLEPEVLLVDEVLAVGDNSFQKKCLGKMGEVAEQGRTVLFVSHNMIAVQNLCDRVIWLHQGQLALDGRAADVIGRYQSASFSPRTEQVWPSPDTAPGNDRVRLRRVAVRPHGVSDGQAAISTASAVDVEVEYWNLTDGAQLHVSLQVLNEQQIVAFGTASNDTDPATRDRPLPAGLLRSTCRIPPHLLNTGLHRILVGIILDGVKVILRYDDAVTFDVVETDLRPGAWYGREPGAVRPRLPWHTTVVDASTGAAGTAVHDGTAATSASAVR